MLAGTWRAGEITITLADAAPVRYLSQHFASDLAGVVLDRGEWSPVTSTAQRFMAALAEYPDGALGPHELCLSCVRVLPVDRAALTIGDASSTWEPLGATDDTAARIESHQAIAGEGPAVDAAERGGPVLIEDLSTQFDRWPGFTSALGSDAHGAMFALPLQIGAIAIGASSRVPSTVVLMSTCETSVSTWGRKRYARHAVTASPIVNSSAEPWR